MQLRRPHRLIVALALLLALAAPCGSAAECSHTLRWAAEPPFAMMERDGTVRGIDIDIVTTILERMGCTARVVDMPWTRALLELEAGRLDILAGAFRTPERERYAWFSQPIYLTANSLFLGPASRDKFHIAALADIIGTDFKLGVSRNASYGPAYESLRSNPAFLARLVPVVSRQGRWKMLAAGRIDGIIADSMAAAMDLRLLGLEKVIVRGPAVTDAEPSAVAFSKQTINNEFVERFDTLFRQLVDDGTYLRIKQKYVSCKPTSNRLACH